MSQALDVDSGDALEHMHGFHSYPARLHPHTAQKLIVGLSEKGQRVLDPFCGSGTTLVEARRYGRRSLGNDLNPLAIELCWLKTLAAGDNVLSQVKRASEEVFEFAEDRRLGKLGPLSRYPQATRQAFPVHVLLELDGLWHGILQQPGENTRRTLRLVLSSLLTKVSILQGDSSQKRAVPRLRSGFATDLFKKKAHELCSRLVTYRKLLPESSFAPKLLVEDARRLDEIKKHSVDLVVSSPPYPGVFDYLEHHRLRLGFFEFPEKRLKSGEIGARRTYKSLSHPQALERWAKELTPSLSEISRTLAPGKYAALVLADSVVGGQALRADELLSEYAKTAGMTIALVASQARPSFHHLSDKVFRKQPRREHLVLLKAAG